MLETSSFYGSPLRSKRYYDFLSSCTKQPVCITFAWPAFMPLPTHIATAKLARKLHKKGATSATTTQATFVTKQMSGWSGG